MLVAEVLSRLRSMQNPQAVAAMAKQGIVPRAALGLSNAQLRQVAGDIGIDRLIAQQLWASGIHDARVLASLVDDPERVTPKHMEPWVLSCAFIFARGRSRFKIHIRVHQDVIRSIFEARFWQLAWVGP